MGLPLPEAGQASTVFSLTALFGAYFGISLLLGLPALLGLVLGTALGLLLIRFWIDTYKPETFEAFLFGILKGGKQNATVYGMAICAVQLAYATSELLILREIAKILLGVRSDHATLLAMGVGIIGYFYVLFGGYMAVFRTDVLQFVLVSVMAAVFGVFLLRRGLPVGWATRLLPRKGYWEMAPFGSTGLLYVYHFAIATVMGLGLLVASPDAWKRVFLVRRRTRKNRLRFLIFVTVAVVPYLMLIPLVINISPIPDGEVNTSSLFSSFLASNVLFVAAALGLVASFLSSFNSALLASVHVGLMLRRKKTLVKSEVSRFHWLMVTALVSIFLLFRALIVFSNPYLLANLLLGTFALIAGVQVGTRGILSHLPERSLLWIFVLGCVCWFLYFLSIVGIPRLPTTLQINTVPGGVLLFFATVLACQLLILGGRKNVRR